jgi:hypothetical protein
MKSKDENTYMYNAVSRWFWDERYLLLTVVVGVCAVVAYQFLFPPTSIQNGRLPKYERVFSDFTSLVDDMEKARGEEMAKKTDGGVGALNINAYKMRLYQIYDYMFVWEMREGSPFYKNFPPREKEIIAHLQQAGKILDSAIVRVFDSYGNPETPIDFAGARSEIEKARALHLKESGR